MTKSYTWVNVKDADRTEDWLVDSLSGRVAAVVSGPGSRDDGEGWHARVELAADVTHRLGRFVTREFARAAVKEAVEDGAPREAAMSTEAGAVQLPSLPPVMCPECGFYMGLPSVSTSEKYAAAVREAVKAGHALFTCLNEPCASKSTMYSVKLGTVAAVKL